jgi:hypothetical protein
LAEVEQLSIRALAVMLQQSLTAQIACAHGLRRFRWIGGLLFEAQQP